MANAFTLFGEISVDTRKFQQALDVAEKQLQDTHQALIAVEKATNTAGRNSATSARQFEKLNNSLREQRAAIDRAITAYTNGKATSTQFANSLMQIYQQSEKVKNSLKDQAARLEDLMRKQKQASKAPSGPRQQQDDQVRVFKALEAERIKAQKAADKAARDAQVAADRSHKRFGQMLTKQTRDTVRETNNQIRAFKNWSKQTEQEYRKATAAAKRAADEIKRQQDKMAKSFSSLGNSVNSVGAGFKAFGANMTMLVTAPLGALGYQAVQASMHLEGLRNRLAAATGSQEVANQKMEEFVALSKQNVGVLPDMAAEMYAQLRPLGLTEKAITDLTVAFGKLQVANPNFDPTQFRINMEQMFTQGFEMQDVKQAFTYMPRFGELVAKAFNLDKSDRSSIAATLRAAQDAGALTMEQFFQGMADAINSDPVYAKLKDTFAFRMARLAFDAKKALEPLGQILGNIIASALEFIMPYLTQLGELFKNLSPTAQTIVVAIGAVAAAIGPLAIALGAVIAVLAPVVLLIGKLAGVLVGLLGGPAVAVAAAVVVGAIALIVAAVTSLGIAIYAAYQIWQKNVAGIQKAATDAFNRMYPIITGIMAQLVDVIEYYLNTIVNAFGDSWSDMKSATEDAFAVMIIYGKQFWSALSYFFEHIGRDVLPKFVITLKAVADILGGVIRGVIAIFSGLMAFVKAAITNDWRGAFNAALKIVDGFASIIVSIVGNLIKHFFAQLAQMFPGLTNFFNKVRAFFLSLGQMIPQSIANGIAKNAPLVSRAISALFGGSISTPGGESIKLSEIFSFQQTGPAAGQVGGRTMGDVMRSQMQKARGKKAGLDLSGFQGGGPTMGGGGKGGGGGSAGKTVTDKAAEEVKRLTDAMFDLNVETETQRVIANMLKGEYAGISDARFKEILALAEELDSIKELADTREVDQKLLESSKKLLEDLNYETGLAGQRTEEQRFEYELLNKTLKNVHPSMKQAIEDAARFKFNSKQQAKVSEEVTQALDAFAEKGLKKTKTNMEELNEILQKATKNNIELNKETVNSATAWATAADRLAASQPYYEALKDIMGQLGVETEKTGNYAARLMAVLANPDALARMAEEAGTTVDKLRERLMFLASEKDKPTILGQLRIEMERVREELPSLEKAIATTLTGSLSQIGNIFASAVSEWDGTAKSFFQSLANGFRAMAQQIIQQLIQIMIMRALAGLGLGAAGGAGGQGPSALGQAETASIGQAGGLGGPTSFVPRATGGLVTGPGTATSDSIPALLSNGEFVIPTASVKKFGVDFFESLRKGQMPMRRYAMGGMVTPTASSVSTSNSTSNYNNVFNIAVPSGSNQQQTAAMVQSQILAALRKHEQRNK